MIKFTNKLERRAFIKHHCQQSFFLYVSPFHLFPFFPFSLSHFLFIFHCPFLFYIFVLFFFLSSLLFPLFQSLLSLPLFPIFPPFPFLVLFFFLLSFFLFQFYLFSPFAFTCFFIFFSFSFPFSVFSCTHNFIVIFLFPKEYFLFSQCARKVLNVKWRQLVAAPFFKNGKSEKSGVFHVSVS